MAHDSRGALLKKGDHVFVEMVLSEDPSSDSGYCNANCLVIVPEQREKPPMSPPTGVFNTRMLTKIGTMLLVALIVSSAVAQQLDVPKEAQYEIARRGTMVEQVGDFQDAGQAAIAAGAETPADDSGKWFLSAIVKRGDAASDQLRADLAGSDVLKKWVDTADYKASWSHFQIFQAEDQSQDFRYARLRQELAAVKISLDRFPVLILQPPLNGAFGDPHTIVMLKIGYNSRPDELSRNLENAYKQYCRAVAPQHAQWRATHPDSRIARGGFQDGPKMEITPDGLLTWGDRNCPFPVCPPLGPPKVQPTQSPLIPPAPQATTDEIVQKVLDALTKPKPAPVVAPAPDSGTGSLWTTLLLGGFTLFGTQLITIALAIWAAFRGARQAAGQPVIPEPIYAELVAVLKGLQNLQKPAS